MREDIRVGGSPILLVEVKGVQGMPKEEDALAAVKYRAPRMEQWGRTDIRGLAVINHQRSLPPLERDNEHAFQSDVLQNAERQSTTLITGFDLFRLVLNKRQLAWPNEAVTPLFYENGRISVVPKHYELVGVIEHFFDKAHVVVIRVQGDGFQAGDRLAYDLTIEFMEEDVESIQVEDATAETVTAGQPAGVKTMLTKEQARHGVRVFKVVPLA